MVPTAPGNGAGEPAGTQKTSHAVAPGALLVQFTTIFEDVVAVAVIFVGLGQEGNG